MKKPRVAATKSRPVEASAGDVEAVVKGVHGDPFAVLGVHGTTAGFVARCFIPGAQRATAHLLDGREVGVLKRRDERGFFEGPVDIAERQPLRYHLGNQGGDWWLADPYTFGPVLGPMDDYYIAEGSHLRLFDKLGAHLIEHEGASGFNFAVWAPNARRVSVVGEFNEWDGRRHVMRNRKDTGIWEIFIPDVGPGKAYKFEIVGAQGELLPLKADPYAGRSELRPATAGSRRSCWRDFSGRHRSHSRSRPAPRSRPGSRRTRS